MITIFALGLGWVALFAESLSVNQRIACAAVALGAILIQHAIHAFAKNDVSHLD